MAITPPKKPEPPKSLNQFIEQAGDPPPDTPAKVRYRSRNLRGKMQQLTITISPNDLDKVDEAAEHQAISRAAFIRQSMMTAAYDILKRKKQGG